MRDWTESTKRSSKNRVLCLKSRERLKKYELIVDISRLGYYNKDYKDDAELLNY